MRIRLPFAGTFLLLCLLAGYAGLAPLQLGAYVNDKALHLAAFFALTAVFYWVVDTGRRRALHLALAVCTLAGGVGSEFLQAWVPNGRGFDAGDIAANLLGSLAALGLCAWYHRRMLERRRLARGASASASAVRYNPVSGEEEEDYDVEDIELGERSGLVGGQEEGVVDNPAVGGSGERRRTAATLDDEVDNWDENALDSWDEEEEEEDVEDDEDDEEEEDSDDSDDGASAPVKDAAKSNGKGPGVAADAKKRID